MSWTVKVEHDRCAALEPHERGGFATKPDALDWARITLLAVSGGSNSITTITKQCCAHDQILNARTALVVARDRLRGFGRSSQVGTAIDRVRLVIEAELNTLLGCPECGESVSVFREEKL